MLDAAGKPPFSHLVYPLPEEGGLGVHLTLDLQGAAKFGPDVQWVDEVCSLSITLPELVLLMGATCTLHGCTCIMKPAAATVV